MRIGELCEREGPGDDRFQSSGSQSEDVEVPTEAAADNENVFSGTLVQQANLGNYSILFVNLDGSMIRVQVPGQLPKAEGQAVSVYPDPENVWC